MKSLRLVCVTIISVVLASQSASTTAQSSYVTPTRENGGAQLQEGLNNLVSGNYGRAHVLCSEAEKRLGWYSSSKDNYTGRDGDLRPWLISSRRCQADALFKLGEIENACDLYAYVDYRSTGNGDMQPACQQAKRESDQAYKRADEAHDLMSSLNRQAGAVVPLLTSGRNADVELAKYTEICDALGGHDGLGTDLRIGVHSFCRGQGAFFKGDVENGCRYFEQAVTAFRKVAHGRDDILNGDTYLYEYGNSFYKLSRQYVAGC